MKQTEWLELGDLTVLVGPNNEGKSNILQALVIGMAELAAPSPAIRRLRAGTDTRAGRRRPADDHFYWERDFPIDLQESSPSGSSEMEFDFQLTEQEVKDFYAEVGSRINGDLPVKLLFGRLGPKFSVRKQRHSEALSAKKDEIAGFIAKRVQVQYVPAMRPAMQSIEVVNKILNRRLLTAARDPEYISALETVRDIEQSVLNDVAKSVHTQIKEYLPDVESVDLKTLRLDERRSLRRDVSIVVDDGTATDIGLKGSGVQSLATMALVRFLSRETADAQEFILAVEEPEVHLHPRAVHALRDAIVETARTQQVVITTHSPILVNRLHLKQNIVVQERIARPAASLRELRDVLGVHTSDNLESAAIIVAVEGVTDERILRCITSSRSPTIAAALNEGVLRFLPLYGASRLENMLVHARDSLASVCALLDCDEAGLLAFDKAKELGLLGSKDVTFFKARGTKESELEDLISVGVYRQSVIDCFSVDLMHANDFKRLGTGKWSDRLRRAFEAAGKPYGSQVITQVKELVATAVEHDCVGSIASHSLDFFNTLVHELEVRVESRSDG